MGSPLPPHEECLKAGLLHEVQMSFWCIFVSHQWMGHLALPGKSVGVFTLVVTCGYWIVRSVVFLFINLMYFSA